MKKYSFFLLLIAHLITTKLVAQNYKDEAIAAKDTGYACFIQLSSDSSILKYNTLKYTMPPMSYGYLEGDGEKLKYQVKDVLSFQDTKGFWLRTAEPPKSLIGKAPFDGFFAVRIYNGKIELFGQYLKNNNNTRWYYFIRKGTSIIGLDQWGVGLKNAIQDNKKLFKNFDNLFDKGKIKDVINIIKEYNR